MSELAFGRRGFLRALAAVPLLGGGLKLFGEPTAAAVPVSADLLRRYLIFLGKEQQAARVELGSCRSAWISRQQSSR